MTTTDGALRSAGFICTHSGESILQGAAAELFRGWQRFLHTRLRPLFASECLSPSFIEKETLQTSGYLDHFPHQLMQARGAINERSDAWCMTPAACLHVYPQLRRTRAGRRPNVLIQRTVRQIRKRPLGTPVSPVLVSHDRARVCRTASDDCVDS